MDNPKHILPAVAAIIFNEEGEVLLQKRKDVGQWCIISGHVEFGETIEEAILREIAEETHVTAKLIRFIGVYSSPGTQTYAYQDRSVQYVTSYFEAKLTASIQPNFSNDETQELKFFHPEHIPPDLALLNPHWLTDALSGSETAFVR
jgi:8-oxo-dGTP diphosphatase